MKHFSNLVRDGRRLDAMVRCELADRIGYRIDVGFSKTSVVWVAEVELFPSGTLRVSAARRLENSDGRTEMAAIVSICRDALSRYPSATSFEILVRAHDQAALATRILFSGRFEQEAFTHPAPSILTDPSVPKSPLYLFRWSIEAARSHRHIGVKEPVSD